MKKKYIVDYGICGAVIVEATTVEEAESIVLKLPAQNY